MFSSLINWIWPSEQKTKNSEEIILPIFQCQNISQDTNPAVINKLTSNYEINKRARKYEMNLLKFNDEKISYKCAVENLSKPSDLHLNEKKFLDRRDDETKLFLERILQEINKHIPPRSMVGMKVGGMKDNLFTAWLILKKDMEPFKIDESFLENSSCYADLKVNAVILINSLEEDRGLRISINKNKCRLYEVIDGSYKMQFNWKVGNEDCSIAANIGSDGKVTCYNISKDLTFKDLEMNKDVKIRIGGDENKVMTLADLVGLDELLGKSSSEEGKILFYGNSETETL